MTCSAGNDPALCCLPGAWERMSALGVVAFYVVGEPLPDVVVDVAAERALDPHALANHVEAEHGWEPHDEGYATAVSAAADCVQAGGCCG